MIRQIERPKFFRQGFDVCLCTQYLFSDCHTNDIALKHLSFIIQRLRLQMDQTTIQYLGFYHIFDIWWCRCRSFEIQQLYLSFTHLSIPLHRHLHAINFIEFSINMGAVAMGAFGLLSWSYKRWFILCISMAITATVLNEVPSVFGIISWTF